MELHSPHQSITFSFNHFLVLSKQTFFFFKRGKWIKPRNASRKTLSKVFYPTFWLLCLKAVDCECSIYAPPPSCCRTTSCKPLSVTSMTPKSIGMNGTSAAAGGLPVEHPCCRWLKLWLSNVCGLFMSELNLQCKKKKKCYPIFVMEKTL